MSGTTNRSGALTFRRCCHKKDHGGKCKYTTKLSISKTAAQELIDALSFDEIKSLAGLDDTKVLQGRDNFTRMRELADKLCEPDEAKKVKK